MASKIQLWFFKTLLIICMGFLPVYLLSGCNSEDDHQAATLEEPTPGERITQDMDDAQLQYEVFSEGVMARIEKNRQLLERYKLNVRELTGEERTTYEQEIEQIEEEIESLQNEVENYEPSEERKDWDAFTENVEERAGNIEDRMSRLKIEDDTIQRN